jgi:hypothetical protein
LAAAPLVLILIQVSGNAFSNSPDCANWCEAPNSALEVKIQHAK